MNETHHSDGDLPKLVGTPLVHEASDKNLELIQSTDSAAITALQNEVIELRQNKSRLQKKVSTSESDSLTGRVDDYKSLIASLAPSDDGINSSESPNQANTSSTLGQAELLESLSASATSTIPIAAQDSLIIPAEKPAHQTKIASALLQNSRLPSARIPESFAAPEIDMTLTESTPLPKGSLGSSKEIGSQIAFAAPSTLGNPSSIDAVQVADIGHEQPTISSNSSAPIDPFLANMTRAKSSPETTIASSSTPQPTLAPRDPFISSANRSETVARDRQLEENQFPKQAGNNNSLSSAGDRSIPDLKQPVVIADKSIPSVSPSIEAIASTPKETRPTEQSRTIAYNPTQPTNTTTEVPSSPEKPQVPNSETPGKLSRDQIASSSTGNSSAEIAPKSQDISRTAQPQLAQDSNSSIAHQPLARQSSTDRPSLIASSNTSDYSQTVREATKDLTKETKDKELQLANAINYPKFGGATPTEESAKPVIQHQKPQSFQSSLARDAAPEKAHPLSESFVSGKILSQPTKDQIDNKLSEKGQDKIIDAKSPDGKVTKTTDAKPTELKTADFKPTDTKSPEGRTPEGRTVDPRNLDSSHLAGSTAKLGPDGQMLPHSPLQAIPVQPTDRVALSAANQSQTGKLPTDNQPTGKTGDADMNNPDKAGKKPETSDDKKDSQITGKGPGSATESGKVPGSKAFNDLLDFIDKADQGDIKPGGKGNIPLGGSNILSPDDVLISGTAAISQGIPGAKEETASDENEASDTDKLSRNRRKYIVQDGDTIESIAISELGDERFSILILTINQAQIPTHKEGSKTKVTLHAGQILWLPSEREVQVHAELYLLE